jgi:integrase
MHPQLAEELKALKRRAQAGPRIVPDDEGVFLSRRGRPGWSYRCAWRRAVERAGLDRRKGLAFYSCRHSFATHYLERGAPSDLQQLMGHASYMTTERYVRAVSDRRARASRPSIWWGRNALGSTGACWPAPSASGTVRRQETGCGTRPLDV